MRHSRLLVWRKPRNDLWNNTYVFVLHKPGLCGVQARISICERPWMRSCNGKSGHEKSKCRLRNANGSTCGKTGHLQKVCGQREESDRKVGPSSSSATSIGRGGKSRSNGDTCCCCGQPGHRRPDCPQRNDKCSRCEKRGHSSQICQTGQSANTNARVVEMVSDNPGDEQYKGSCGLCLYGNL